MNYTGTEKQNRVSTVLKVALFISRVLIGIVFTFSGFVKLVDPLGTAYKFGDYFKDAFHVPDLAFLSLHLAFVMNIVEFATGVSLLLKIKPKIGIWLALLFMILFTPVTLFIAITDSVHDCGCFGDALVLSNWDTFYKNLVIIAIVIFMFFNKNKINSYLSAKVQWFAVSLVFLLAFGFEIYNYRHLPMKDFRPYKVGTYIPDGMIIPEGKVPPAYGYNYTLKHIENNQTKVVDSETYLKTELWKDTLWAITETGEPFIIKEGYVPPIHDLRFEATEDSPKGNYAQGDDLTDLALADENYSFWIVMYDMQSVDADELKQAAAIIEFCTNNGYNFYVLTSTALADVKKLQNDVGVSFPVFNTDPITLKTIIRANPGYVLLKKGTVLSKWHYNDMPLPANLSEVIKNVAKAAE